jgi:hypothetical protein
MNRKLYEELIRSFCKAAGINDAPKVLETHEIVIENRTFAFFYDDEIAGQDFVIYVDIPFEKQHADAFFFRALLEANYLWEKTGGTTLGLHPERNSIGLCIKLAVTEPNGDMLYTAVQHLDQLAKSWQEAIVTYFQSKLDQDSPTTLTPANLRDIDFA